MSEANSGITVTTKVEYDFYSFGVYLASLGSDDQAAFLEGFSARLYALGVVDRGKQLAFVVDECDGCTEWFAEELHEAFNAAQA